ncbi:MAG: class I SAM-dependent methyltransferase [Planctomycetia bacterium]|nr:class I SAM-dependent methyltransferase [Planctomycetia bacterium]
MSGSPGRPAVSSSNNRGGGPAEQAAAMDRMYRFTRHVYDVTRAYYLLGRDRLLERVATSPATATLEVGCGTARNLIRLARRPDPGALFGLDASHEMLETAASSIARSGVERAGRPPIVLRQGLAEELDARRMFGREEPFDTIYFSYCLSMVPTWPGAIEAALANLKPGGEMLIVDFWDQQDLPRWFAAGLTTWLALFHVHYRPEVHDALVELGRSGRAEVTFESVSRRYAYIATVRKR